jgi:hypothetical protein
VTEVVLVVPEHFDELLEHFALHHCGGFAAVDGVVVGIEHHCRGVRGDCDGVRWLEHLARILRVKEGKVVV